MNINTKYGIQKGKLPDRYLNQIENKYSVQEKYISERERTYEETFLTPDSEKDEIIISTTYKEI